MFKKAKKQLQRVGTEVVKAVFSIDVQSVHIAEYQDIEEGALVSVCFERGGKICSSSDKNIIIGSTRGPLSVSIDETLALVATLYRDPKNSCAFQDKKGKLIFRQLKKTRLGGEVYKGLGYCNLSLHCLAQELAVSGFKQVELPLSGMPGSAVLGRMSVRFLSPTADDDNVSILSGMSDMSDLSTMGATFDAELDGIRSQKVSSSQPEPSRSAGIGLQIDAIHEEQEEDVDEDTVVGKVRQSPLSLPPRPVQGGVKRNTEPSTRDKDSPRESPGEFFLTSTSSRDSLIGAREDSTMALAGRRFPLAQQPTVMTDVDGQTGGGEPCSEINLQRPMSPTRKSGQELELLAEIKVLRCQCQDKDEVIARMERDHDGQVQGLKAQIQHLRKELIRAQADSAKPAAKKYGDAESAMGRSDTLLASALSRAREECSAIAEEYATAAAELQAREEEVQLLRQQLEQAIKDKDLERIASIEAATAAATASYRRAELEEEAETLLADLIETKMKCANMALEVDDERKKVFVHRKRLQKYAERVAALEVSLASHSTSEYTVVSSPQDI